MNSKTRQAKAHAARWLTEMQSSNWDDAQQNHFELWLHQSPLHRETYVQMQHVWQSLNELADSPEAINLQNATPLYEQTNNPTDDAPISPPLPLSKPAAAAWIRSLLNGFTWFKSLTFSSVALASLSVAFYLSFLNTASKAEWTYASTAIAEIQNLRLKDGSHITLNGRSTLQYRLSNNRREVQLLSGQAFFDVAKDANRPFIIDSGETRINVVGTQFDVKNIQDIIRIAVLEGHVKVSALAIGNTLDGAPNNISPKSQINSTNAHESGPIHSLYAGNKIEIRNGGKFGKINTISRKQIASWRSGNLIYENTPLREVIDDVNRYFPGKITIDGNTLGDTPITAAFSLKNIDKVPSIIKRLLPVVITDHGEAKLTISDEAR